MVTDCHYEIKTLAPWNETMTNLDRVLKPETLPTKVHIITPMVFPVVLYGYNSLTIKKAEH